MIFAPDLINGLFEGLAGFAILGHCNRLYKDKKVKGVSLWSTIFFTAWGGWNIYYYPILSQLFSFYAGLLVLGANLLWVGMIIYYKWLEMKNESQ